MCLKFIIILIFQLSYSSAIFIEVLNQTKAFELKIIAIENSQVFQVKIKNSI